MTLVGLSARLRQHGVSLTLTPEGKLRPTARQAPPEELLQAVRDHRDPLVRRLARGQRPDGRLDVATLSAAPGRCVTCRRWTGPDAFGDGLCPLGRHAHGWLDGDPDAPVITAALHVCAAHQGNGWQVRRTADSPGETAP